MASTLKLLAQAALTNSNATYYTVPASTTTIIKEILFNNTSNSTVTITLYFVKSGESANVKNTVFKTMDFLPYETKIIGLSTFLNTGATIQGLASVTSVVGMSISGVEMT